MTDPLQKLYNLYPPDFSRVKKIVSGEKFSAVMFHDGDVGVCANLGGIIGCEIGDYTNPDLSVREHRIFLISYYNANFNSKSEYQYNSDIIEILNKKSYSNIVMIGFFDSIVARNEGRLKLNIFDNEQTNDLILPPEMQDTYVKKADALVITASSVQNNTYNDLLETASENCDIYIIGPSSTLHNIFFSDKRVKMILGSVFVKNNQNLIKIIEEGSAAKDFLKYGRKVVLINKN